MNLTHTRLISSSSLTNHLHPSLTCLLATVKTVALRYVCVCVRVWMCMCLYHEPSQSLRECSLKAFFWHSKEQNCTRAKPLALRRVQRSHAHPSNLSSTRWQHRHAFFGRVRGMPSRTIAVILRCHDGKSLRTKSS